MLKNEQFNHEFKVIDPAEWHKWASPWGNSNIKITMEDILALLEGKDLYFFDGEYGTYVRYINEVSPEVREVLERVYDDLYIVKKGEATDDDKN